MNGTLERDVDIPLNEWIGSAVLSDDALYGLGQAVFVKSVICDLLIDPNIVDEALRVVSEHRSRSVIFPVYRIGIPGVGWVQFRGNEYNWIVSCSLNVDIPNNFGDMIFAPKNWVAPAHAEGFNPQHVFQSLMANPHEFTVEIRGGSKYVLYAFMYILRTSLQAQGAKLPDM